MGGKKKQPINKQQVLNYRRKTIRSCISKTHSVKLKLREERRKRDKELVC
jgi:hypothetical protein